MKLLFVSGTAPLSRLIMWGLKEPVSHFAILFDDKLVFHSDLMGVHISWLPTFLKKHTVVFEIEHNELNLKEEEEIYQAIITEYDGKQYDYLAFVHFVWRGILWRLFNIPMPTSSKFQEDNGYLCTEMARALPDFVVPIEIKNLDLSAMSPFRLYRALLNKA